MGDLHSAEEHGKTQISAVIFDLDGTLLSTEHLTKEILKEFLAGYGKVPDKEKEKKRLGMTQKEYAIGIVSDYDLPLTPDQYIQAIMPFYHDKWLQAKALPGANRLIRHFHKHGVPFALASNSKRKNIDGKVSRQEGWIECFSVILGSDQVKSGKPSPDIFLEAAKQMGADAAHCLVIEDSVIGVKAGKAAGMKVVAVPSFHSEFDQYSIADSVLRSLLELKPELWGLPPFEDWVDNALLVEPVHFRGLYKNGLLLDFADDGPSILPDQVFGVYFGWAKPEAYKFIKIVLGVGWGHGCCSSKRKIQACIVDSSDEQIQHCKMEAVIVGYIRGSHDENYSLSRRFIGNNISDVGIRYAYAPPSLCGTTLDIPHDDSRNTLSAAVMLWPKHTFPITATDIFSKFVKDHVGKSDKIEILEEDKSIANAALNLSEFSLGAFKSLFSEVALQDDCDLNIK